MLSLLLSTLLSLKFFFFSHCYKYQEEEEEEWRVIYGITIASSASSTSSNRPYVAGPSPGL